MSVVLLFDKVCLYDIVKDEITIYGQSKIFFDRVFIENTICKLVFCEKRPDFYIKLKGKVCKLDTIIFIENTGKRIHLEDIHLHFPFEDCDLQINSTSAIISTMCKNYSHRLDEWIQYNLKLGFSGIVIFNNDGNKTNDVNEPLEFCSNNYATEEICRKYKGKVFVVDMPYSPFVNNHFNSIQGITLTIAVNAFRNKCRNIALIDADEFIYFHNNPQTKIEDFLQNYKTITMGSNILTNKNDNDLLDNNILQLAKYVGENKYSKIILYTGEINENEFITTPHVHRCNEELSKVDIIHYHCWMNKRYKYTESMLMMDISTIL